MTTSQVNATLKMAQHKYELSTVATKCKGPPKNYPWYRERLHLKFLKSKQSAIYNGVNWTFIPSGIDDFRTGIPRNTSGAILRQWSNPVPLIGMAGARKTRSYCSRVDIGDQTLYNKMGPTSRLQRDYLRTVELGILRHPIVLYPRLMESIPTEMVNDVVRILDPLALNTEDATRATYSEASLSKETIQQSLETALPSVSSSVQSSEEQQSLGNHNHLVYKFPLMKTADEIEREKNLLASQQVVSAKQQSRVTDVTRDLVQWGAQLGGTGDLDEHVIRSLFGSDYETKPISMAPIQVVELDVVPNELRVESRGSLQQCRQSEKFKALFHYYGYQRVRNTEEISYLDDREHRVVKTKYGAWYLPKRLWKVRHWDEPLNDPEVVAAEESRGQNKKNQDLDEGLSELHGAKAFKEFILAKKPGVTLPSFLKSVDLTSEWIRRNI